MLPTENHPPVDPHEISLKGVDLSNPSIDEHNHIPKFSIRDYVFNTRSKNIKTNWPFSEKNLQLCLKHGVKDILPPFQCLDCVKNRLISKSESVESSSSEKQKVINSDMDPPNHAVNKDLSVFESRNNQLSVIKNNSPAEVPPNTSEKSISHPPKKTEISKPSSMKKCKLVVKVGPSSNSNIASSSMAEPVASSKICPVCKKFSSSSNTKLNAHIDQCLSVESPIEPRTNSRVMKHKIKPKKTRLMVDIYATAPHCTIEELDRRNGRIWNEKPSLPTVQENRMDCVDEVEKQKQSVGFDEKGDDDADDEGAVYIDAKGTKLRILNKISDTSSASKLGVNPLGLRKPLKRGKEGKLLLSYKKKQKHNKYSKLVSQREKVRSYKTRLASRVLEDQEEDKSVNEIPKEDENIGINSAESSKSRELIIKTGSLIPKWASSKGTGLLKRRVQSDESSLCESYIERSYSQKVHNWYEIPKKVKKIDNFSSEGPIDEYHEQQQPFSKKKMEFKSVKSRSFSSVDQTFSSRREPVLSADRAPILSKKCPFRVKSGHGYSEKNLKHQNRIDQVPNKKSNVLKIKKKKQAAIITSHRNESAQDHGNREPPRVDSRFEEGFADVEPPRRDEMVIGQSLGHDSGNVMSLGKSFDQDFYSIGGIEIGPTDVESNYFSGVDPITIPGPPGSFLPSPGRTSSEEDHHQGNSSLTNSQVQSSIDCLELVDRDSSNSPKSAHSTVSNTLLARSESENLCLEPRVPEDEIIKLGFSDVITKSTLGFQDNQPCCCSRKEGASVNNQEYSHLLKRRVMSSSPAPPTRADKQSSSYQNITVSPPVYGDFGSPSPSSPNPILRLMGKDLVVVNSDENINHSPSSKLQAGPSDDHQVSPNYGFRRTDSDLHEYKPSFINRPPLSSPFSPLGYNKTERVVETLPDTIQRNNRKDVIVIHDDAPENEARTDFINVIQESSGGFPIPLAGYYNSRHLNPFSSYQGTDFSTYRSPHMIPNTSSPVSPSSLGPMRWNNSVLEGSRVPPASGSLTPSPSAKRAKSSLYYSPSMS